MWAECVGGVETRGSARGRVGRVSGEACLIPRLVLALGALARRLTGDAGLWRGAGAGVSRASLAGDRGAWDAGLEALAVLLEAARLLAVAPLAMPGRVLAQGRVVSNLWPERGWVAAGRGRRVEEGATGGGGRVGSPHRSSVASIALARFSLFSGLLWQPWQLQPKQYWPDAKHSQ